MATERNTPSLSDLSSLREQIERDNADSMESLRSRDRAIGEQCSAEGDVARLLFWLKVIPEPEPSEPQATISEAAVAAIVRVGALIMGFAAMASFLVSGGRLVNVFAFFLIFSLGAILAFFVLLLLSGFGFVWGSTFGITEHVVKALVDIAAAPWATAVSSAVVSSDIIVASQFQQGVTRFGNAEIMVTRQWWPFLIMSMSVYALLPRIILWWLTRIFYRRGMRLSLLSTPGAERILSRMKTPHVTTEGESLLATGKPASPMAAAHDTDKVIIDWAGALAFCDRDEFDDLKAVPAGRIRAAGTGSLGDDLVCAQWVTELEPLQLLVVVKAWEPPLADLQDFIARTGGVTRCTLCLLPLHGRAIKESSTRDWRAFSRELAIDVVDVLVLDRPVQDGI